MNPPAVRIMEDRESETEIVAKPAVYHQVLSILIVMSRVKIRVLHPLPSTL
jgi:hypothetical protein